MMRRIPRGLEGIRPNKARTGCSTCETRNPKCDGEKPTCQKCRLGGMKCDGHGLSNPRAPQQQAIQRRRRKPQNDPCQASSSIQFPVTSVDISGGWLEKFLFHHVRAHTIKDLGQSASLVRFWSRYVLPLGHNVEPIKHALIALGAAHRCFLWSDSDGLVLCSQGERNYQNIAIKHYNQAIKQLHSIMSTPSRINMPITLVCCLIFVCLENVRGQYNEALRHLRAGSRLLGSLWRDSKETSTARTKGITQKEELARRNGDFDQLCKIADMFSRLGMDAGIFVEDNVISMADLEIYNQPADENTGPFISAEDAEEQLFTIDRDMDLLFESIDYESEDYMPSWKKSEKKIYYGLQDRYNSWVPRFNAYMDNLPGRLVSAEEFNQAMRLCVHKKVWYCIFKHGPDLDGALDPRDLEEIVDQIEPLIKPRTTSAHPIFTFDAEFLPAMSFAFTFTMDAALRKRIVGMLRSANRREGVWDSQELASIYEAACSPEENGVQVDELFKKGFLTNVRELSSKGLLKLSSKNGVMRLAESGEYQCWSSSPESDSTMTTQSDEHTPIFTEISEEKIDVKREAVWDLIDA